MNTFFSVIDRVGDFTSRCTGSTFHMGSTQLGLMTIGATVGATLFVLENQKEQYDPEWAMLSKLGKTTACFMGGAATGGVIGAYAPMTLPALCILGTHALLPKTAADNRGTQVQSLPLWVKN